MPDEIYYADADGRPRVARDGEEIPAGSTITGVNLEFSGIAYQIPTQYADSVKTAVAGEDIEPGQLVRIGSDGKAYIGISLPIDVKNKTTKEDSLMQIVNNHRLLIFIERPGLPHEAWTVVPAADKVHLIAVAEDGRALPFGYVENDCTIGTERFRFVQMLPDKEFVAVPWTAEMDEEQADG